MLIFNPSKTYSTSDYKPLLTIINLSMGYLGLLQHGGLTGCLRDAWDVMRLMF